MPCFSVTICHTTMNIRENAIFRHFLEFGSRDQNNFGAKFFTSQKYPLGGILVWRMLYGHEIYGLFILIRQFDTWYFVYHGQDIAHTEARTFLYIFGIGHIYAKWHKFREQFDMKINHSKSTSEWFLNEMQYFDWL